MERVGDVCIALHEATFLIIVQDGFVDDSGWR
jgi:hypothetical protein